MSSNPKDIGNAQQLLKAETRTTCLLCSPYNIHIAHIYITKLYSQASQSPSVYIRPALLRHKKPSLQFLLLLDTSSWLTLFPVTI